MPNWKKLITSGSSGSLSNLIIDNDLSASLISGSFYGDGSGLTGINVTVVSSSTVTDSFTNETTHSIAHTLGTKDLIVNVYDSNDDIFVPSRINTPTTSSVVIYMDPATTGRVVIGKAGHIVSGSTLLDNTGVISGSAQIASDISGSFTATSSSISTRLTTAESELSNTLISSSAQIATDISGSFTSVSASIATELNNATGSVSLNTRDSSTFSFWQGSQAQYDALGSYDSNVIYFTT